jgi:hypothetical protein
MSARVLTLTFGLWLWAASCSTEPGAPKDSDLTAGQAEVVIGADGFGTLDGVRMPWEAIVLRLRQRVRALPPGAATEFLVRLGVQGGALDPDARRRVEQDRERMLQQLDIMDVGHVQLFFPETR